MNCTTFFFVSVSGKPRGRPYQGRKSFSTTSSHAPVGNFSPWRSMPFARRAPSGSGEGVVRRFRFCCNLFFPFLFCMPPRLSRKFALFFAGRAAGPSFAPLSFLYFSRNAIRYLADRYDYSKQRVRDCFVGRFAGKCWPIPSSSAVCPPACGPGRPWNSLFF